MSRLSERFGLSGNGLAKICRRLDAPYPPRGYWAKLAAGKKVKSTPLPKAKSDIPSSATIYWKAPNLPEELSPELAASLAAAIKNVGTIRVPGRIHKPHAIVAGWLAEQQRQIELAKRDRWGSHYRPRDFTHMDRRRHRLLDALFKELERQGAKAGENDRRELYAEVSGERLEFELREKYKQVRRPLTTEELRWGGNKSGMRQELQPTGFFLFTMKRYLPESLRREWLERDDAPIEGRLAEIVATFLVAGPIMAEERRQREERARREEEERQRGKQDRNRWRRFAEIAKAWEEVGISRRFLQTLRAMDLPDEELIDGKPISEWLDWAERKLKAADPVEQGIGAIFRDIASIKYWTYHD